jgi:hypothetical protein
MIVLAVLALARLAVATMLPRGVQLPGIGATPAAADRQGAAQRA